MAILLKGPRIFKLDSVVEGLQRVRRGVLRIETKDGEKCTGWFIAPHLIAIPGFAIRPDPSAGPIYAEAFGGSGSAEAWEEAIESPLELVGEDLLGKAGPAALALLRTRTSPPRPVLDLSFEAAEIDQSVFLLHFPLGQPETCLSLGRIAAVEDVLLHHDADTQPGSSGGPLFDHQWRVTSMHFGSDFPRRLNKALAVPALLRALRESSCWNEIAEYHQIANVSAARREVAQVTAPAAPERPAAALVKAATLRIVDPESLSEDEKTALRPHVADPDAPVWLLRASARESIIRAVGSLEELRKARGTTPAVDKPQQVIDRILAGPPYDLGKEDEDALSWWIQAARWFAPVEPALPKPALISLELERRRIRSRLRQLAGPTFRGRAEELDYLRDWFARPEGPLSLTGIGGIGKSALVAAFVSELPPATLLLWLDFDRADLAPDDAVSVLSAISSQAALQLTGFVAPEIKESDWREAARALGAELQRLGATPPPLLVLDSFEAAQYTEQYQELWPVLEEIAGAVPALRLIVTGRAPVKELRFRDQAAVSKHLEGLRTEDARAWLEERGVKDQRVLDQVLILADGVPLILRLAVLLIEKGGSVSDLPSTLPPVIVVGFLYERILGRVQTPSLKEVARAALVLRRLSVEMVDPILRDAGVNLPPGEIPQWFADLVREVALVEGTTVLRLRPEVRSATLQLIDRDDKELVRKIDERAARWYAQQDLNDLENVADLVYHRLRLGDLEAAQQGWRDGCAEFLTYAVEDLPEPARSWLAEHLGSAPQPSVRAWEQSAVARIRQSRKRGLHRNVERILEERAERSDASPLVFQNAYELHAAGKSDAARDVLVSAGPAAGPVGRDRAVMEAFLSIRAGDRRAADRLLASVDGVEHWRDRRLGESEHLAVRAARIKLTVDLAAETRLLERLDDPQLFGQARAILSPIDAVLPQLQVRLRGESPVLDDISRGTAVEELQGSGNESVAMQIERERRVTLPDEPPTLRSERERLLRAWADKATWHEARLDGPPLTIADHDLLDRAEAGWRRGHLGVSSSFLYEAFQLSQDSSASGGLSLSILGCLAVLARGFGGVRFFAERQLLSRMVVQSRAWDSLPESPKLGPDLDRMVTSAERTLSIANVLVELFMAAPDPLEQLVYALAGVADRGGKAGA